MGYQRRVHGECSGDQAPLKMKQIILFIAFFGSAVLCEEVARKPKLFFVSTSATTSTLQTAFVCYVTSAAPTSVCGRKKRRAQRLVGRGREGSSSTGSPPPPSPPPPPSQSPTQCQAHSAHRPAEPNVDRFEP